MEDDRVEETEPWTPENTRRLWIVVFVTLTLGATVLVVSCRAFIGMMRIGPGGVFYVNLF